MASLASQALTPAFAVANCCLPLSRYHTGSLGTDVDGFWDFWYFHPCWAHVPPAPVLLRSWWCVSGPSRHRCPRPLVVLDLCFQNILSSHASGRCQGLSFLDWVRCSRSGQRRAKSESPDFGLGMANWSCVL